MVLGLFRPILGIIGMDLGHIMPINGFLAWIWAILDLFQGVLPWILAKFGPL